MNACDWKETLKNKKVFIWGASIGGTQACTCLEKNGIPVEAYCDNDIKKQGTLHNGKRIISPDTLKDWGGVFGAVVVIASYAYEVIYRQIRKMELPYEVYVYLLYDPCHLKRGRVYTKEEKEKIRSLYERESYTSELMELILEKGLLNSDGFGSIKECEGYGGIDKYYYDNIACRIKGLELTLLDVGSYTGDSVLQIREVFGNRISRIYAFEPNKENCEEIRNKKIENFVLHEFGLGKINGYTNFSEEGPFFRVSREKEGIPVRVAKLDDLEIEVKGKCILKIDIEGSERDCLEGAKEFIKKNKPYIAVCVYHREEDIMELPQYLRSLVKEYTFYLRGGMHTVCYAFPEEES